MYGHFLFVQKTEPAETAGSDIFVMYRLTVLPQIAAEELIIIQRIDAIIKNGLFRRFGLQPERFKESERCVQHQNQ